MRVQKYKNLEYIELDDEIIVIDHLESLISPKNNEFVHMTIPEKINGKNVVEIGKHFFDNTTSPMYCFKSKIRTIYIPKNIIRIDEDINNWKPRTIIGEKNSMAEKVAKDLNILFINKDEEQLVQRFLRMNKMYL